jgi:hypothetical protein
VSRQQRRYEARKGVRVLGFIYVSSKNELRPSKETRRSWAIKPSKSDNPSYRKPCGERAANRGEA